MNVPTRELILGGIAFVLLTGGVIWFQFTGIGPGDAGPSWSGIRWAYLPLVLVCLPIETLASGLRTWVLCRVLQPGISLWSSTKAEWANVALSTLTPSQSGGGAGQIYILCRGGASVGTALTISLLSFSGTMAALLCMGMYSLLVSGIGITHTLFVAALWILTGISAAIVAAALWPVPLRIVLGASSRALLRLLRREYLLRDWWPPGSPDGTPAIDRMDPVSGGLAAIVCTYGADVRSFLRRGKLAFAIVCLLSMAFLAGRALVPFFCLRLMGIESSSLVHVFEVQLALIFLVFFAPTPGAAGLAESASMSIMAGIVPAGFAPYYNLLWRFTTLYLAAAAGLICVAHELATDTRKLVRSGA